MQQMGLTASVGASTVAFSLASAAGLSTRAHFTRELNSLKPLASRAAAAFCACGSRSPAHGGLG
jgi:hypothetical protein